MSTSLVPEHAVTDEVSPLLQQRSDLIKKCSPYYRSRIEALWGANDLFKNPIDVPSPNLVMCIRAIGNNATKTEGSAEALMNALNHNGVKPLMIQEIEDVEWPNHWLVHASMDEVSNLPGFCSLCKGIFWNSKGPLMFFIWCIQPRSKAESAELISSEVPWKIRIPMTGTCDNLIDTVLAEGISIGGHHAPSKEVINLKVIKATMLRQHLGGMWIKDGNVLAYCENMPPSLIIKKYLSKKPRKSLNAFIGTTVVSITLLDCCEVCGAEHHENKSICPYESTLQFLLSQISIACHDGEDKNTYEEVQEVIVVKRTKTPVPNTSSKKLKV